MRIQERRRSSSIAMSTYHRIAICLDPVEAPPHGAAAAMWRCGARQRRRKLGSGSARAAPAWRIRPRTASFLTVHIVHVLSATTARYESKAKARSRSAATRPMRARPDGRRRQDSTSRYRLKDTSLYSDRKPYNQPKSDRIRNTLSRCGEIDLTCGND